MTRKLRFGIIGTGRISDWVLKGAVLDPRFEAAAVCSRDAERGSAFASKHGIPKVSTPSTSGHPTTPTMTSPSYAFHTGSTYSAKSPWPQTCGKQAKWHSLPGRTESSSWRL